MKSEFQQHIEVKNEKYIINNSIHIFCESATG